MLDYYKHSYAAAYRAGELCVCGHNLTGHPAGFCNGYHMSGGASGMQQRCGCQAFTEREEKK